MGRYVEVPSAWDPSGMETPQHPGWYDDPDDPEQLRYFDGIVWTSHTTPRRSRRQPAVAPSPGTGDATGGPGSAAPPLGGAGSPSSGPAHPSDWDRQASPWSRPPGGGPATGWSPPRSQPSWTTRTGGPTTVDGVPLAPYLRRVGAYVIDALVKGVVSTVLGAYWTIPLLQDSMNQATSAINSGQPAALPTLDASMTQYILPLTLVSIVVNLGYNAFFLSRYGATPGKMALGISVRRVQGPGPISVEAALRRYALQTVLDLASLVPVLGLTSLLLSSLDLLWPLRDPKRQAWHDKIADTQVVLGPQPR